MNFVIDQLVKIKNYKCYSQGWNVVDVRFHSRPRLYEVFLHTKDGKMFQNKYILPDTIFLLQNTSFCMVNSLFENFPGNLLFMSYGNLAKKFQKQRVSGIVDLYQCFKRGPYKLKRIISLFEPVRHWLYL